MSIEERNILDVSIHVSIRNRNMGGGLDLNQSFNMQQCDFANVAEIMSRFHELMKTIEAERGTKPRKP
jgi:hypothetical protein